MGDLPWYCWTLPWNHLKVEATPRETSGSTTVPLKNSKAAWSFKQIGIEAPTWTRCKDTSANHHVSRRVCKSLKVIVLFFFWERNEKERRVEDSCVDTKFWRYVSSHLLINSPTNSMRKSKVQNLETSPVQHGKIPARTPTTSRTSKHIGFLFV